MKQFTTQFDVKNIHKSHHTKDVTSRSRKILTTLFDSVRFLLLLVMGVMSVEISAQEVPVALTPASAISGLSTTPTLVWSAVSGATSYTFQISTTTSFSTLVTSGTTSIPTAQVINPLSRNVQYFWRVRWQNGSTSSAFSALSTFTTAPNTPTPPSSWAFTSNTGNFATLAFPSTSAIMIGCRTVSIGDAIGVFYATNGTFVCAGSITWTGTSQTLTAWGDDNITPTKDGFFENEQIQFRVWDAQTGNQYIAQPTLRQNPPFVSTATYVSSGLYVVNGLQSVLYNATPQLTALGTTTFCSGSSVELRASTSATYVWSNGATTQAISVTQSGNYTVTMYSSAGCTSTSSLSVTVNSLPVVSITPSTTAICIGNSVVLTATGANTYLWSNGATTAQIIVSPANSEQFTVTGSSVSGCLSSSTFTVVVRPLPIIAITASTYTSICRGSSVSLTAQNLISTSAQSVLWSNGSTAATQVFTPTSTTTLSVTMTSEFGCVTSSTYTIVVTQLGVPQLVSPSSNAVISPIQTTLTWTNAECASYYILEIATSSSFTSFATSLSISITSAQVTLNYSTQYFWRVRAVNGNATSANSSVWSFTTIASTETQNITVTQGWNLLSINVTPTNASFSGILANQPLVIARNSAAQVYWPEFGVDQIGSWNTALGYQMYFSTSSTLSVTGFRIQPTSSSISLSSGWNWVAYWRSTPLNAATAFSGITSQLVIARSISAQVYWPELGINTLTLVPGQGYQVYMTSAALLQYPANSPRTGASEENQQFTSLPNKLFHPKYTNTGSFSTLVLRSAGEPDGAEIGVFANGMCVGSGVFSNGKALVTIWGDNEQTSIIDGAREHDILEFQLKTLESEMRIVENMVWQDGITAEVVPQRFVSGNVVLARLEDTQTLSNNTLEVEPNPANEFVAIRVPIFAEETTLRLANSLGEIVAETVLQPSRARAQVQFSVKNLASGMYVLSVVSSGQQLPIHGLVIVQH